MGNRSAQLRRHHCVGVGQTPRRGLACGLGRDRGGAKARTTNPARLAVVKTPGLDEHIWRPSRIGVDRAVTIIVDLTVTRLDTSTPDCWTLSWAAQGASTRRGCKPNPRASSTACNTPPLDPFRGHANAIRDGLPDAIAVLDAFHVVRLGTQVVDEVRRRVQQDTLGCRGHKHDPLYQIRGLLRHAASTLATRAKKSTSPGSATRSCGPSTTPPRRKAARSRSRSWTASTPAPSPRSPGSDAPSAPGKPRSGLLRHLRCLQRRHRSHQPHHRESPSISPRIQRL
jgi:hypothetical protein